MPPTAGKPVALAETVAFAPAATSKKAFAPTLGAFPKKTTLASALAPQNTPSSISVTLAGMVMEARALAS